MSSFSVEAAANSRLDEIANYTRYNWGEKKAVEYIDGLFAEFAAIASGLVSSRRIPAELGVTGYRRRYRSHYIYWQRMAGGEIAIMTILHERMQQALHVDEIGKRG